MTLRDASVSWLRNLLALGVSPSARPNAEGGASTRHPFRPLPGPLPAAPRGVLGYGPLPPAKTLALHNA